jgi:hypothetical protein
MPESHKEPRCPQDIAGINAEDQLGALAEVRHQFVVMALGEIKLEVVAVADGPGHDEDEANPANELHESPMKQENMLGEDKALKHPSHQGKPCWQNGEAGGGIARHRLEESIRRYVMPKETSLFQGLNEGWNLGEIKGKRAQDHRAKPKQNQKKRIVVAGEMAFLPQR